MINDAEESISAFLDIVSKYACADESKLKVAIEICNFNEQLAVLLEETESISSSLQSLGVETLVGTPFDLRKPDSWGKTVEAGIRLEPLLDSIASKISSKVCKVQEIAKIIYHANVQLSQERITSIKAVPKEEIKLKRTTIAPGKLF